MFHFDGNFKRNPEQNLGGSSLNSDRQTLIKNAQNERKKREECRRKEISAIKIQSMYRSYNKRQLTKKQERLNYEQYLNQNGFKNFNDLEYLLKRLLYYYELEDADKLINLCQFILKNVDQLFKCVLSKDSPKLTRNIWQYRVQKLLVLCLRQIFSSTSSYAIPMTMIENFTSYDYIRQKIKHESEERVENFLKRLFSFMIDQNYFQKVRQMIDEKIPENAYDEETTKPHNQLSGVLLEMLKRPLKLVSAFSVDRVFDSKILSSFCNEILAKNYNNTISYFILPALATMEDFPFIKLIQYLNITHDELISYRNSVIVERAEDVNNFGIATRQQRKKTNSIEFNSFLLFSVLKLDPLFLDNLIASGYLSSYLTVIGSMVNNISKLPKSSNYSFKHYDDKDDDSSTESDVEREIDDEPMQLQSERVILTMIIQHLNDQQRVMKIVENIDEHLHESKVLLSICRIGHNLMIFNRFAIYEYKFLYMLAFKPKFIRTLWYTLLTAQTEKNQHSISILSKGIQIANHESEKIIPILSTFCALFGRLLSTLHDGEFFFCSSNGEEEAEALTMTPTISGVKPIKNKLMPFHIKEIVLLSTTMKELAIGLVELAFPETRSTLKDHYRNILTGITDDDDEISRLQRLSQEKSIWSQLLKVCVSLVRQLHTRNLRCNFCTEDHWIAPTLNLPLDKPTDLHFTRRRGPRPFQPIRDFTRKNLDEGPPLSTKQIRSITILREIPFVIPFNTRVGVLQGLLSAEKLRSQGDQQGFLQGPQIHIVLRRTHLYEDAFDKLSPENEPDLRARFRVQMINTVGLEEAGIDGGGVFREFLSELIKSAFDPHRGFFILTKDNMLYPNPSAGKIVEDYQRHYYFIGRMLGKALFENLLVELPLAEFFLSKLAGRHSDIIDIHQLISLDPVLHRNLMSLKAYEGDVSDLGLDFTVVSDEYGETKVENLKPDGANITVNTSNRIEYIQLMADFKLNRQIKQQCLAFRNGLANVLPIEWLYMFNTKELQVLMSGAEIPVDVDDLMHHTRYGGDYGTEHKTIKLFWDVVRKFDDNQLRQLLKFVTSCSRPPLLGFKDLDPPFCIQNSGDDAERLPSASTCMNLLKLPPFDNTTQLREKLLYAIQSGVGFELS